MTVSTLRDLFDEASDLPADARESFLELHCHDRTLRARLERMLAADATPIGALPRADATTIAIALEDTCVEQTLPPDAVIGPFKLIDVLGEGGSSTVFRAARSCDGVRQVVALKLLRRGVYTHDARQQFRRERQALSMLGHPGIARLIEGGVTEAGLAYIALELVDGAPITHYVREHRLNLHQRLRLFLDVCRAVDAAHHALIVHRDLKPSNVLVTAAGAVKLLDFGIAKLLDGDDATQTRLPAFTPAYASPEQRNGGLITTATDVYALGVLLGELLTGERLNDTSTRTPSSLVRTDAEPGVLPAPAATTRRQLRGDADNIVLKAIDADASRRYASASALADDIERLLRGLPVHAHPTSAIYRARKFAMRHRAGVATTLLVVLALVAALGVVSWQARVARSQARRATDIQNFLESLFQPFQDGTSPARAPSVNELLKRGMARVTRDFASDPRALADTTAMFARINDAVGEVRGNLDLARAAWIADARAYGDADMRTLQSRALYARVLRRNGNYDAALAQYEAVRAAMQTQAVHNLDYACVLDGMAITLEQLGRMPQALQLKRASVAEREADPAAGPDDLADGYNGLG
ncbi:MAG: serine/threonine-protein kinase, partial [Rudaea sp.]